MGKLNIYNMNTNNIIVIRELCCTRGCRDLIWSEYKSQNGIYYY